MRPAAWILAAAAAFAGAGWAGTTSAADCNQNGIEDSVEIRSGAAADCNANGIPDPCDVRPVNYSLNPPSRIQFKPTVSSLALSDLDGDGGSDAALFLLDDRAIDILWSAPGRPFAGKPSRVARYQDGDGPVHGAAGDIDGDGDLDLIAVRTLQISIVENLGARKFRRLHDLRVGFDGVSLDLGDLDGDGDLDLALAGPFHVAAYVNPGDGRFAAHSDFLIGTDPAVARFADIDADGDLDLVSANRQGNLSIFLNAGGGRLEPPRNFATVEGAEAMEIDDLDGDRRPEILVSAQGRGVLVHRSLAEGGIAPPESIGDDSSAFHFALADLDGDGDRDLVTAPDFGRLDIALLDGAGRRISGLSLGTPFFISGLQAADADGDGLGDVIIPLSTTIIIYRAILDVRSSDCNRDEIPDECQVAERDCNQNQAPDDCDIAGGSSGDCDGNGIPDECQTDCNSNGVPDACDIASGAFSDCDGNGIIDACDLRHDIQLRERFIDLSLEIDELVAADADGDGDLDLWHRRGDRVGIIRNQKGGKFVVEEAPAIDPPPVSIAAADFDGDGAAELAMVDGEGKGVRLLEAAGPAGPGSLRELPLEHLRAALVIAADVDGNGAEDIVVAHARSVVTSILFNEGGGIFGAPRVLRTGQRNLPLSVWARDFDGDGRRDVILHPEGKSHIVVFFNRGKRKFSAPAVQALIGPFQRAVDLGDLDQDGDLDLLGVFQNSSTFLYLDYSVEEGFAHGFNPGVIGWVRAVRILDLDHDRRPDMLVFTTGGPDPGWSVIAGSGPPQWNMSWKPLGWNLTPHIPNVLAPGDFDGDGDLDLVIGGPLECCPGEPPRLILLLNDDPPGIHRDRNWDHVPDLCAKEPPGRLRGDVDGDGGIAIADAVALLEYLFLGIPVACRNCADLDGDGAITVNDAVRLLLSLFPPE